MSERFGWSSNDLGVDYTKNPDAAVRYVCDRRNKNTGLYAELVNLVRKEAILRGHTIPDEVEWTHHSWKSFHEMMKELFG